MTDHPRDWQAGPRVPSGLATGVAVAALFNVAATAVLGLWRRRKARR